MSQLTSKFESETGNKAMYRKDGADYHTLRYVNWLEALAENCSAQNGPTNNGSTYPSEIAWLEWLTAEPDAISERYLHNKLCSRLAQLRACR